MTFTHPLPVDVESVPCRKDAERMFPTTAGPQRERDDEAAKTVCRKGRDGHACHLLGPCLRYSLRHSVQGVWAGTTEDERKEMQERNGIDPLPLVSPAVRRDVYRRTA